MWLHRERTFAPHPLRYFFTRMSLGRDDGGRLVILFPDGLSNEAYAHTAFPLFFRPRLDIHIRFLCSGFIMLCPCRKGLQLIILFFLGVGKKVNELRQKKRKSNL
jgi:hypothetical protein